jgi:hypothetical protein
MIRTTAFCAIALSLAVAGCGGGDDGGGGGPSKAEFIEEADAICAAAAEQAEPVIAESLPNPENPSPDQILDAVQAVIPIQRDTVARVAELERPEGDEDEIQEFVDKAEAGLDEAEKIQDPQAAVAVLQAADTPQDPFYEANQAAEQYGFRDCAE